MRDEILQGYHKRPFSYARTLRIRCRVRTSRKNFRFKGCSLSAERTVIIVDSDKKSCLSAYFECRIYIVVFSSRSLNPAREGFRLALLLFVLRVNLAGGRQQHDCIDIPQVGGYETS